MSADGLPLAADFHGIRGVSDLLGLLRVPPNLWTSFVNSAGDPGENIRVLAALPPGALRQACLSAILDTGDALTPMQATHVGLVWRSSRKWIHLTAGLPEMEFNDLDPWEETKSQEQPQGNRDAGQAQVQAGPVLKERVLKMSTILDQADESEVAPAARTDIDRWMSNYVSIMGAPPPEEEEPSEAQLSALHKRVVTLAQAPYTDFGVFLPFSRRAIKSVKFRTYFPVGDGTFILKELPGPQNYQQWLLSWRVFKTSAIMLDIISLAALLRYEKLIERLVWQWPKAWGLIYAADDKARAEHVDKIRRRLLQDQAKGNPLPPDFQEASPWTTCFRLLAQEDAYWDEQVRHPAAAWMASGGRGVPMAAAEQVATAHHPGIADSMDMLKEEFDPKKRQANRDKRAAKSKRIRDDRGELERLRASNNGAQRQGQDQGGKGKSKGKSKDQAGTQICYSFANGVGPCGNVSPGATCLQKTKRARKCQHCLSPSHRNADCPQAA